MRDLETRTRYAVDGIVPDAVALPESQPEVAAVLQSAADVGSVVVPWGAGTKQDLGNPLERIGLVLSLERLNRVVDYIPADMTITVEAGMRLADIQAVTTPHGQTVALDPAQADRATIGGIVATGASGPRRMAYGGVRDLLLGVRVALTDGRLIRAGGKVVKNVAGYDLTRLIVGSLGTLGVITEVSLRLRPVAADRRTLLFPFAELDTALDGAERVLNSELLPVALTLLSADAARRLGVSGNWPLAVALEESVENNRYQAEGLSQVLGSPAVLVGELETAFWHGVANYGEVFDAGLRLRVSTVIGGLRDQMRASPFEAIAHVGSGSLMLYGAAADSDQALDAVRGVFERAGTAGASAVLESGPVALRRQLDVWGPARPEWKLAERIKETLDPGRVLNRGRFVGGT